MRARSALRQRPGTCSAAPRQTSSRSQLIGVCPSGTSCFGSAGAGGAQLEGELVGQRHGARDGAGVAGEPGGHLGAAAQVRGAGCGQPAVELVEAAAGAHRGERGREAMLGAGSRSARCRSRGRQRQAARRGRPARRCACGVERVPVVDQLDEHASAPEQRDEQRSSSAARWRSVASAAPAPSGPPPAPGAPRPCGIRSARSTGRRARSASSVEVVHRPALLAAGQLRRR